MTSHAALDVALDLARERLVQCERALAAANAALQDANSKLVVLETYAGDYLQRMRATVASDIPTMLNTRAFVAKLNVAVDAQRNEHLRLEKMAAVAQENWKEARKRERSIEILKERRATQHEQRVARSEQKQSDEFAARSARERAAEGL